MVTGEVFKTSLVLGLERGGGGVLRQTYTPLYPLFLEGSLKVAVEGLIWLLQSSFVKKLFVLHVFLQYMIRPP